VVSIWAVIGRNLDCNIEPALQLGNYAMHDLIEIGAPNFKPSNAPVPGEDILEEKQEWNCVLDQPAFVLRLM